MAIDLEHVIPRENPTRAYRADPRAALRRLSKRKRGRVRAGPERIMSTKIFLSILSVLALVFGLAFVFAPDKFGDLAGLDVSASMTAMARLMGAAMLAWGMILWSARRFSEEAQAAVLRATALADAVGAASAFVASVTGAMDLLGWAIASIFLVSAMACMGILSVHARPSNVVGGDARGVFDRLIA
jgi:hypothetical protein